MLSGIILPDMQVPYHDKLSVDAAEKYMASRQWDIYLNLGDFLDFNEISTHVIGKPGAVKENVAKTFKAGREILYRHREILGPDCRMVVLQGNHDYRAVSYGERHPPMKEILDVPENLHFKDLNIEWVKSWEKGKIFRLGHAGFIHGGLTRKHHAAGMVEKYGIPIYYGHTHDIMFFPKTTEGDNKTLEAGSLGCLCRYDQKYLKGRPTNWQQAVSTIFVQPGGNYNLYVSRIFNHRFVAPDGVEYIGRKNGNPR